MDPSWPAASIEIANVITNAFQLVALSYIASKVS